jgi:hypothetical protein
LDTFRSTGISSLHCYVLIYGGEEIAIHKDLLARKETLFHCSVISQIITRERFELITRCLHVANVPAHVMDRDSSTYDKLHKVR